MPQPCLPSPFPILRVLKVSGCFLIRSLLSPRKPSYNRGQTLSERNCLWLVYSAVLKKQFPSQECAFLKKKDMVFQVHVAGSHRQLQDGFRGQESRTLVYRHKTRETESPIPLARLANPPAPYSIQKCPEPQICPKICPDNCFSGFQSGGPKCAKNLSKNCKICLEIVVFQFRQIFDKFGPPGLEPRKKIVETNFGQIWGLGHF